jgi:hypothetical protein
LLYKPILLTAYKKVCSDVVNVQGAFRSVSPRERLVLVRCADERVRALRLIFTGVVVPNLGAGGPLAMQEPQSLLAMLGLHWQISYRPARHDERSNAVVVQEPAPGLVVRLGTTIRVVISR